MGEKVLEQETVANVSHLSQEEDDRMYRQGLQDFVAGNRDTAEARHYVSYWVQRDLGEVAVKTLAD